MTGFIVVSLSALNISSIVGSPPEIRIFERAGSIRALKNHIYEDRGYLYNVCLPCIRRVALTSENADEPGSHIMFC